MSQYKVVNQEVEIGGVDRRVGDILDESAFAPAPEVIPEQKADGVTSHKSELESLLSTGHVVEVTE